MAKYTITYDERNKGFTSFWDYIPEWMLSLNNEFYSFKNGQLYLHNDPNADRNNFYGSQFVSKVTTIFNQEPSRDKVFKTLTTESTTAWAAGVSTNYTNSTVASTEFNNKESRWFAYIRKSEDATNFTSGVNGVGEIVSNLGNDVTFSNLPSGINVGDSLYQVNGGNNELIGVISGVSGAVITVTSIVNAVVNTSFAFIAKSPRIEGAEIRGYFMEVELESTAIAKEELFAVDSNVILSYV